MPSELAMAYPPSAPESSYTYAMDGVPTEDVPYQYRGFDPSQWAQAQQAYQGAALDAYNRMASGESSAARYQQAGSLGQVRDQMGAQSVGRGGGGLSMMGALRSGAGAQQDAMRQAAAQRAQEAYQAQRGYAGALSSTADQELQWQAMNARLQEDEARQWAQMSGVQASQDAANQATAQKYAGATASAVGNWLGTGAQGSR
jgi:hypothetical protein